MPPPITSTNDLENEDNLADARMALHRALVSGDAALAAWARTWGESAIEALQALHDDRVRFSEAPDEDEDDA